MVGTGLRWAVPATVFIKGTFGATARRRVSASSSGHCWQLSGKSSLLQEQAPGAQQPTRTCTFKIQMTRGPHTSPKGLSRLPRSRRENKHAFWSQAEPWTQVLLLTHHVTQGHCGLSSCIYETRLITSVFCSLAVRIR